MTPTEVTTILRQFNTRCTGEIEMIDINELRRLAQAATPGPWKMLPVGDGRQKFAVANSEFLSILTVTDEGGATFGTVYDDADARFIAAANPTTVSELLDRLEAAESDALEQARLNGMGSEREAALMAKLEAAEKERNEFKRECFGHISDNSLLRARIEAMEKQEPLWFIDERGEPQRYHKSKADYCKYGGLDLLYALPGAKGE